MAISSLDRKTMLRWSFRELWMIKSLFLASFKKICVVFSYFTQEEKENQVRMSLSKHRCWSRKKERWIYIFSLSRHHKVDLQSWSKTGPLVSQFSHYNLLDSIYFHLYTKEDWKRQAQGTCDSSFVKNYYNTQSLSAHLKMLTISR